MTDGSLADEITMLCAWCGVTLRQGGSTVSHGICRDCAPTLLEKIRERLEGNSQGAGDRSNVRDCGEGAPYL